MPLPVLMTQVRTYADAIVKVPQMAESITEGTLKQWSKQVGQYVEQDEEIATIETDKVRGRHTVSAHFPLRMWGGWHVLLTLSPSRFRSMLLSMRRKPVC